MELGGTREEALGALAESSGETARYGRPGFGLLLSVHRHLKVRMQGVPCLCLYFGLVRFPVGMGVVLHLFCVRQNPEVKGRWIRFGGRVQAGREKAVETRSTGGHFLMGTLPHRQRGNLWTRSEMPNWALIPPPAVCWGVGDAGDYLRKCK